MELSKRLNAVAAMVTSGHVVCDVGCDHGYVAIFLAREGISPKIYAMDVREGPLAHARAHVKEHGCEDYIDVILSDGIKGLPPCRADTLICAGMGGRLVMKILSESMAKVRAMKELVLQPQSEIHLVRKFIRNQGFLIADENMIEEDGKYYPVMRVLVPEKPCGLPGAKEAGEGDAGMFGDVQADRQEMFDRYGPVLLAKGHPVLKEYLMRERAHLEKIGHGLEQAGNGSERAKARLLELEGKRKLAEAALAYMEECGKNSPKTYWEAEQTPGKNGMEDNEGKGGRAL